MYSYIIFGVTPYALTERVGDVDYYYKNYKEIKSKENFEFSARQEKRQKKMK